MDASSARMAGGGAAGRAFWARAAASAARWCSMLSLTKSSMTISPSGEAVARRRQWPSSRSSASVIATSGGACGPITAAMSDIDPWPKWGVIPKRAHSSGVAHSGSMDVKSCSDVMACAFEVVRESRAVASPTCPARPFGAVNAGRQYPSNWATSRKCSSAQSKAPVKPSALM